MEITRRGVIPHPPIRKTQMSITDLSAAGESVIAQKDDRSSPFVH
jgi:hypothetical protein